jgi:undecaprenyl-diphosphatase
LPSPSPIIPITYFQALILGIVQGITEFLPVSSTAHMRILPALLHHFRASWPNDTGAAFSAIVQLGPIVAIIVYFWPDIIKYLAGIGRSLQARVLFPRGDIDARLGWYTILGTIPLIIAGLALEKRVDGEYRNLYFISAALIVLAIILWLAERGGRKTRALKTLTLGQAMLIGVAQTLALVPGASRSGVTYTTGLFINLTREAAIRFSFLLSIPAITLAGLYKLIKVLHATHLGPAAGPYLFSAFVAGIFAYIVVRWLLKYLGEENHSMMPFIIYRIALGIALLFLVHVGIVIPQAQSLSSGH